MINKKIHINKERNVYMETYFIENNNELKKNIRRPVIIICPGGAYTFHSEKEGERIALHYVANGFHAAVLHYGVGEFAKMPGPVKDVADTVAYLRNNAKKYLINPENVFVSGFSAGAHAAASLGVFWNNPDILPEYKDNPELVKPNGMILGYPVLDLHSSLNDLDVGIPKGIDINDISNRHFGQIHPDMPKEKIFHMDEASGRYFVDFEVAMNAFILGGEYTAEQEDFYSLQNHVSKDTPPTFIWHTAEDGLIKPANTFKFATKLMEHEVPYEVHIFGNGGHGTGLGNYVTANYAFEVVTAVQPWIKLAIDWVLRATDFDKIDK